MKTIFLILLFSLSVRAEQYEDIVKYIEANLSPPNFASVFEFTNYRLDGTISVNEVKFQSKDIDHMHGTFLKPEREKGREVLRVGDALWTYMPSVGRALRIADRDSFAGGDFSNADVLRADWSAHYSITLAKETKNQWILDLKSKSKESAYSKMRLWVDKSNKQPIQQNFYDSNGTLLKTCIYGSIKKFGSVERPAHLLMQNVLTKQKSELKVLSLKTEQKLEDKRFTVDNLGK